MEKKSSTPVLEEQPSISHEPQPQTLPADSQKVAFKLGGSDEADLDNNDMETKDFDISNGEKEIPSYTLPQFLNVKIFPSMDIFMEI